MSNLKIYGVPLSRAYRALWMANELGLDYENVPIHFADGSAKTPEYLAVNPNGRIPAIDDNGFKLWESMAINLYLAKKHGSGLSANVVCCTVDVYCFDLPSYFPGFVVAPLNNVGQVREF